MRVHSCWKRLNKVFFIIKLNTKNVIFDKKKADICSWSSVLTCDAHLYNVSTINHVVLVIPIDISYFPYPGQEKIRFRLLSREYNKKNRY